MNIEIENPDNQRILNALGLNELDEWNDDKRFDATFVEDLQSLFSELMEQVATAQDAVLLFFLFLGRNDGEERAGWKYSDIITELYKSDEYNSRKLSYLYRKFYVGYNREFSKWKAKEMKQADQYGKSTIL